ncbi:hypothetical protein ACP4OV_023914 [Aristida adscensionis]
MADEEEQKKNVDAGEEEEVDEEVLRLPPGFRFQPNDEELVAFYLLPRLEGKAHKRSPDIIAANVYESQPDTLIEKYKGRDGDEWFFLSPRARIYQNGARPSRKTEDGYGRWKASTASTVALTKELPGDGEKRTITFRKNVLNYFAGNTKSERRTKWLMRELTIPEFKLEKGAPNNALDEYVMCRIYVSPVNKGRHEEASTSSQAGVVHGTAGSSYKLPDRQAGKRPMVEQQALPGCAAARKQARHQSQHVGPAPVFAAGGNVPGAAAYYGAPGQAMVCNGGGNVQPPAGGRYGPAPVQRPAVAYGPQAPAPPAPAQRPPTPMHFPPRSAATNPNSMMMRAMDMPMGHPGNPPRRHLGWAFVPPELRDLYYDDDGRAVQPPGNASYGMPQQQTPAAFAPPPQRQPYHNGNASHNARAPVVQRPPHHGYSCRCCCPPAPAPAVRGAANTGTGMGDGNKNAEHHFVELASINMSMAGAYPPVTAPAPRPESPAPTGAARLDAEMEETSGLDEQDTV